MVKEIGLMREIKDFSVARVNKIVKNLCALLPGNLAPYEYMHFAPRLIITHFRPFP